jgi:RNA polymerase sigma-70 factor (ECF subfamily)
MFQLEKNNLSCRTKSNQQGQDVLAAQNILQLKGLFVGLINESKMDRSEEKTVIRSVLDGDTAAYESLIAQYQPRVFATARKYARRESEVEDIVQEIFIKAFKKLDSYREEAPFEHWLMKISVRTCYDYLRKYQRSKVSSFSDITQDDFDLLDLYGEDEHPARENQEAVSKLINDLLEQLQPAARMVITLLDIEGKSVKEIAKMTGWSVSLVKVRAFRARKEMRKILENFSQEKYL